METLVVAARLFLSSQEMAMACSTTHQAVLSLAHAQHLSASSACSSKFRVVAVPGGRRRSAGNGLVVRAESDLGDFGARDPYPEELGSNFGSISLGNATTEHQILVPTLTVLSLSEKSITPLQEGTAPLTEAEAKALLRKVIGWRLLNQGSSEAGLKLQCDWNLQNPDAVKELYARIARVPEAENYQHEIQTLENNKVQIEIWTPSIGGLSENDFIFASKIDQVETKDLTRRIRTWF